MKSLLRRALSDVTYRAIRLTNGHAAGLRILMYHRVTDAHPGNRLCVPVAQFTEQMRFLHEAGYQTVTLAQAVQWVRQETGDKRQETGDARHVSRLPSHVSDKAVVLTFDDGFEDNFRYAYPAMTRYGFTGCFFVPSGFIEAGANGHSAEDRPMTWAQLSELLKHNQEIGAHSISHVKLTTVDAIRMRQEVRGSKEALEQKLQRPVEFFCYPSGDHNEAVKQAVRESGYRGACTVQPGANLPGHDLFTLTRTEISAFDSRWDFEKKLVGAYDWLHRAVQWMKR